MEQNTMIAPVRAVKQVGPIFLVGGLGVTLLFSSPITALVGLIGIVVSAIAKMNESSVAETKRRSLSRVWSMFGGYATFMAILCGLAILASLLLGHPAFIGPIVFFTLLTCWLPLFANLFRRK